VDRGNRRLIMIFADGTVALATLFLAVLFALHLTQIWHIYVLLFVRAVAGGFHQSAFGASVVLLVPKDQLSRVQGFNQALNGGLNIVSAPLGAFLYAAFPMQAILSIDVLTAMIAISIVAWTSIPQPQRDEMMRATFFQDFVAGFRYIIAWRGLVIVLLMVMVINFFYTAAESLTPILISKHFQGNAENLGVWQSAFATGVLLGGILLGTWGGFKKRVITAQVGLIVLGVSTAVIGFTSSKFLWFALGVNAISGLILPMVNGSFGAILQSVIAPDMQGRVFAFIMSAASLVSPVGLMVAGPFADAFGVPLWFRIAGLVCALMGLAGFFIHEVMQMEEEKKGLAAEPS
jgi:DHA3 family macrolide efflux protein-like MFS transporter